MRPIANRLGNEALYDENCLTADACPVNPEPATAACSDKSPAALAVPTSGILDPVFGGLAQLAARACQTPVASIVLAGCGEAWCTTAELLPPAAVPLHDPFSGYTLLASTLFEVPDATLDE